MDEVKFKRITGLIGTIIGAGLGAMGALGQTNIVLMLIAPLFGAAVGFFYY